MVKKVLAFSCLALALTAAKPATSEAGIIFLVRAMNGNTVSDMTRTESAVVGGGLAAFGAAAMAYAGNCMAPSPFCAIVGLVFFVLENPAHDSVQQIAQSVQTQYGASARDAEDVAVLLQNAARDASPRDGQITVSVSERDLRAGTSLEFQATQGFARLVSDLR